MAEDFLLKKLNERRQEGAFRQLRQERGKVDFCSNDFLGIATNNLLFRSAEMGSKDPVTSLHHGSGGSRLLAGNYALIEDAEFLIADFHQARAGLIFNSGYDANLGLLSCLPGRGDTILFDQLSHASLRDGIRLSFAFAFSFLHNDLQDLEARLHRAVGNIFVVTESVFSMDGDLAPLERMAALCRRYQAHLIIDEAHATGVMGTHGAGLVQYLGLQDQCFARIHTFGKGLGCHGAIILGSEVLRSYLINFCRPFIYTTALPETSVAAIISSYRLFPKMDQERKQLNGLVRMFLELTKSPSSPLKEGYLQGSFTPIQALICPGNEMVGALSEKLGRENLDVRPVRYPSVPKGKERLRIVLHSFNSQDEVLALAKCLAG